MALAAIHFDPYLASLLLEALPDFELSGPVERGRAVETRMPLSIPVTA